MDLAEGPFSILYMHSKVQSGDNNPGMSVLRWIYEELPSDAKERLKVVYFLHPGIYSRLAMATLGRWFLSGGSDLFSILFLLFGFFHLTSIINRTMPDFYWYYTVFVPFVCCLGICFG